MFVCSREGLEPPSGFCCFVSPLGRFSVFVLVVKLLLWEEVTEDQNFALVTKTASLFLLFRQRFKRGFSLNFQFCLCDGK